MRWRQVILIGGLALVVASVELVLLLFNLSSEHVWWFNLLLVAAAALAIVSATILGYALEAVGLDWEFLRAVARKGTMATFRAQAHLRFTAPHWFSEENLRQLAEGLEWECVQDSPLKLERRGLVIQGSVDDDDENGRAIAQFDGEIAGIQLRAFRIHMEALEEAMKDLAESLAASYSVRPCEFQVSDVPLEVRTPNIKKIEVSEAGVNYVGGLGNRNLARLERFLISAHTPS